MQSLFFVVRCVIFFLRFQECAITLLLHNTWQKDNNIGSVTFNHLFTVENLVIISIRDHISLRRCPYFPSMGLDRCPLFLWRRCVLRKCKLVSYNSRFYIYIGSLCLSVYILVNVFRLFYTLMCFMMPFNFIYTKIQHDNSLYNNHIKWFWLITRRHMSRHGSLSEGSLHESVSHNLNAKGSHVTQQ